MEKKKFAAAVIDPEYEIFVIHVTSFSSIIFFSSTALDADIHLSHRPQIAGFITKKTPIKTPIKYTNFANVLFPDLTSKLSKYIGTNNYFIKLVDAYYQTI